MIRSHKRELSGWRYWRAVILTVLSVIFLMSILLIDLPGLMGFGVAAELREIGRRAEHQSQIGDAPEVLVSRLTEAELTCHETEAGEIYVVTCSKEISRGSFVLDFCCTLVVDARYQNGKLIEPVDWKILD